MECSLSFLFTKRTDILISATVIIDSINKGVGNLLLKESAITLSVFFIILS